MSEELSSSKQHRLVQRINRPFLDGLPLVVLGPLLPFKVIIAAVRDFSEKKLPAKDFWIVMGIGIVLIPLMPVLVVVGLLLGICHVLESAKLVWLVRSRWSPQGKRLLFVYSDSPTWKARIETEILPKITQSAIILNWSKRNEWEADTLAAKIFRHWVGERKEFNPVAVTFAPWWKPKVFRFWRAFKSAQHGKSRPLEELQGELFRVVGART